MELEQNAFVKLSAGSETVLIKVTCFEQKVMIGSGLADLVGLEVTTGASTVSVSRMSSVAS